MEFKQNEVTTLQATPQTPEEGNTELAAKDRLENVDTIRQILFGEDRRILDAKIQNLTATVERLSKAHQDELAALETRLRAAHAEETNQLKRMLTEANVAQKNALDALANNSVIAAKSSQAAFENKLSVLQIGVQTLSESSNARIRELAQTHTNSFAQLKNDSKILHDASMKNVEEKFASIDKKIVATAQSVTNYMTPKQFSDALRSLAKEFDMPSNNTAQPFQR
jgi:hypothetical protein